jgi:YVTN family beta-propeller protein
MAPIPPSPHEFRWARARPGPLVSDATDTFVYVATHDSIAIIDATSRTVVARVAVTGAGWLFLSPAGDRLYAVGRIAVNGSPPAQAVAVIDTWQRAVISSAPLASLSTLSGVAALPNGAKLYIAGCRSGSVTVFDASINAVSAQIPLAVNGVIAADPTGSLVYAATFPGLAVIDAASDAVVATIAIPPGDTVPPEPTLVAMAFDPAGTLAYVAAYSPSFFGGHDGRVFVIDTSTRSVLATILLDQVPTALTLDPAGPRLYVAGFLPASCARPTCRVPAGVAVVDTAARSVLTTIPPASTLPYGTYNGIGHAQAAVWRPATGDWFVLDAATGAVSTAQWGAPGDVPVPADYDGDGKTDFAVWRPSDGTWSIKSSKTGEVITRTWGAPGDWPAVADFDGDRKADISVYRP